MKKTEIRVYLVVYDFKCSPHEITKIMKLKPTQTGLKGEPITENSKMTNKCNYWEYHSKLKENIYYEKHVSKLLIKCKNLLHLKKIGKHRVNINCAAYMRDLVPAFHLSAQTIKKMARFNITMDIDGYLT